MKNTLITILVLVLVVIGLILLAPFNGEDDNQETATTSDATTTMTDDQETNQQANVPVGWETYRAPDSGLVFQHPPQVIIDTSNSEVGDVPQRTRVRLIGPESEENTEITDGFTFYARATSTSGMTSLESLARDILERETERAAVVDQLSETTFGDRRAFQFSVDSELGGEVQHAVVAGEGDTDFVTSFIISGSETRDYESQIETMIETLNTTSTTTTSQ